MGGQNIMLQGLWGIQQRRNRQREFYCDASFDPMTNIMGFAVLELSNSCVNVVFSGWKTSVGNALEAEIIAIYKGVMLMLKMEAIDAVLYSDLLEAVAAIYKGFTKLGNVAHLVDKCFAELEARKGWSVEHILREENIGADKLANWARTNRRSWMRSDAVYCLLDLSVLPFRPFVKSPYSCSCSVAS
ncbi:hypothetical protein QQ045_018755 [Rhodiola kirilowii]